ncbi:MAG: hypothetical protein JRI95_04900 [Deltaproteobacteria bacterium]|nr:hypothetical protein [Deltaproteobacteria bacterium]
MISQANRPYSLNEQLAVFISREIEDGEPVGVGRNLIVPMAGALLAHMHHGPNIKIGFDHTRTNVYDQPVVDISQMDWWTALRWAESFRSEDRSMISLKQASKSIFFIGGIQIDKYGNSNMIGVGTDFKKLTFRGPGAIGTASLTTYMDRYYIFLNSHTKRLLVDRCDFVSCVGWNQGGKDARKELGIPGGGPKYCITPLCIMDFDEETKHMRLKSVHPGVTVDNVLQNTGFDLVVPEGVETTPEPEDDELDILRNRIDPKGLLRK